MERWVGKVAIVTGASSGMGYAFAKALTEKGMKVAGLARRSDRIEDLACTLTGAPGELFAIKCDVTNEADILEAFKWVKDNMGPVHVLINNAGLTRPTNLTDGETDAWRRVLEVNVLALCICTREAVRTMKENGIAGHVIHMNSVVGHFVPPMPNFNVYPASKYAVTALTESYRQELRDLKLPIKVTSISPGVVRTEFDEGISDDGTREAVKESPALQPQDVVGAVLYVLSTPPHVQIHELTIRPLFEGF